MTDYNDIVPVLVIDGACKEKKGLFPGRKACGYLYQPKEKNSSFQETLKLLGSCDHPIIIVTQNIAQEALRQIEEMHVVPALFLVVPSYKGSAIMLSLAAYALKAMGKRMLYIEPKAFDQGVALDEILQPAFYEMAEQKCVTFCANKGEERYAYFALCRPRVALDLLQIHDSKLERLAKKAYFAYKDTPQGRVVALDLYADLPSLTLVDFEAQASEHSFVCVSLEEMSGCKSLPNVLKEKIFL